ncbi:MAG: EAL domain-containing protein [Acidobacteriaceae bacterium]|nr:EAL domain-containing protein [Acidobacteriaceae bacterium]
MTPAAHLAAMVAGGCVTAAGMAATAVWSRRYSRRTRRDRELHAMFLAAAESSLNTFTIFTSVRDEAGKIIDFRLKYANANAEALTGKPRAELAGKNLSEIVPVATTSGVFEELCQVARSGVPLNEELAVPPGCLSTNWLRLQAVRLEDGLAITCSDVTERRQMLNYMTHLATHDQLTGLLGRTLLGDMTVEAVERARRFGTKVAIFMIDLDQFKRINDSLGHASGDQILIETAQRLRRAVRSTDVIARVGGDEFVVVMPDIISVDDVERCAVNLVSRISPEMRIEGQLVHVAASVGVCIYPDFAADAKHLLNRADAAMYAAKENGRNQYRFFSEDMLKETSNRLAMEHALRHALANEELCLHYQPQVSLATGTITGMEALLRWKNPQMGQISPAQFIPVAEETGLIVPIGEWAIQAACREAKMIQHELELDLTLSINLSPRQFLQGNLVQVIEQALIAGGFSAGRLEVEITENMLMVNSGGNLDKLQKMRELGVHISIDDFGTGFSSFSYLLQYQVDRLKIDQSFVKRTGADPNADAVVRTIIALSHGLGIRVVAEGVETASQLRFLQRKRCDIAQGNFLMSPVSAKDFIERARRHSFTFPPSELRV